MKLAFKIVRLSYFIFVLTIHLSIFSSISDYIYPNRNNPSFSNYGTLGLIQMPNARFHEEGSLAFSWSSLDPYKRGSIIAYPFSWFEASYQYTDIDNALYSDVPAFSGSQSFKDKGFSAKFLIFNEKGWIPAVSLGLRDFAGTGLFSSEYLVASKRFNNLDITLGMGWGAISQQGIQNPLTFLSDSFKNRVTLSGSKGGELQTKAFFRGNISLFGGIEYIIPNFSGARLKIEYDGTDYDIEGFPDGSKSSSLGLYSIKRPETRLNVGVLYPVSENFHLKLGYIKGNTLNLGFSVQLNLGKKNSFIKKSDPPVAVEYPEVVKKVTEKDTNLAYKALLLNLNNRELYLQKAHIEGNKLSIEYTQSKYGSFARATGRVARVLDDVAPEYIEEFNIINLNGGMGMHQISIPRDSFRRYKDMNYYSLLERDIKINSSTASDNYEFAPKTNYPATFWKVSPAIRSQIGGPDGFYFGDLRLAINSETLFAKSLSFSFSASHGIYDTFDNLKLESDSILPHVRTDIVKYLRESRGLAVKRAQFNYFLNPSNDFYAKFSMGIFEEMFGGAGFEVLYRPFKRNYGIGMELWNVKQRDYDQKIDFRKYETLTGHLNFYYKHPRSQIILAIKGGKFLAKDSGFNFDFSRRFSSGLRIGAFFSLTDISKEEFGEGSFDKGFYFYLPVEMFFSKYSKGNAGFGLRPITRDGASYLVHGFHLWGVTEQAQSINISRDLDDIYD